MIVIVWFFATPMPIMTVISVCIALLAYKFQKNEKRKDKAYQIADRYSKNLIPRARFISCILKDIGIDNYIKTFQDGMIRFDNYELTKLLNENCFCEFKKCLEKINIKNVKIAVLKSGFNINSFFGYNIIDERSYISENNLYPVILEKILYNFLNEVESLCVLLRYNIADEKIIYQPLHLIFLGNIKYWYYFISKDNYLNGDRYYDNLIWLYNKWNKRKNKQIKKGNTKSIAYRGKKL
ncbi:MAG: DUF4760 domain-containing protein [Oscillospiraceae bacterium]|nr:DUF4760 domain-containing protein [Oscillospiraceae bacterium]